MAEQARPSHLDIRILHVVHVLPSSAFGRSLLALMRVAVLPAQSGGLLGLGVGIGVGSGSGSVIGIGTGSGPQGQG